MTHPLGASRTSILFTERPVFDFPAMFMAKTGIKPFTKGDPRINRRGRGKGVIQIADLLRRIGTRKLPPKFAEKFVVLRAMPDEDLKKNRTMLEALMEVVYWCAMSGESWAVQFIADRTEGKVKDVLAFEPTDEGVEKARRFLAQL